MDGAKSISAQYMFAVSLHVEMDENGISFEVEDNHIYIEYRSGSEIPLEDSLFAVFT